MMIHHSLTKLRYQDYKLFGCIDKHLEKNWNTGESDPFRSSMTKHGIFEFCMATNSQNVTIVQLQPVL